MATAKKKATAASAGSKAKAKAAGKAKAEAPKSKAAATGKGPAKPAKKPAKPSKPSKPAKPSKAAATKKAEPKKAEPKKAEPKKAEPKKTEPKKAAKSEVKAAKAPAAKAPAAKAPAAKASKVAPKSAPAAKKSRKSIPAAPPSRKSVSRLPTLRSLVPAAAAATKPASVTFNLHDLAVHPSHGVGEVVAIEQKAVGGGAPMEFYVLLVQGGSKVIVPVKSAAALGLRQIMTATEADAILDTIRSKEVAVKVEPWSRRFRIYQEMVKSKSLHEVAKVMRDMHRLRGSKNLSFGEQNLLDKAKGLLLRELSLAKRVTEQELEGQLEAALAS
jgi:CarD family transcriptional regulator